MQLFYTTQFVDRTAILEDEETRHLVQVLRKKTGDTLHLTDGLGRLMTAEIVEIGKKNATLQIITETRAHNKPSFELHVAIAPTKNIDRFEWFLEKATEIGITEITPIFCQRSERNVIKPERLKGILLSAMKQSLKTYLPILNPATDFSGFLKKNTKDGAQKFIAYCNDPQTPFLGNVYTKGENALICIGPEGDFSEKEVDAAKTQGFLGISLGKSRLRTETAGVVAVHTVGFINEN
jgi:16S rRNA (uracil1498-N3)-methyltransferase